MPAAAIPLIATGISAGSSLYSGAKNRKAAKELQAQQQMAIKPQADLAKQLGQQSGELFRFGMPQLQQGASYYNRLLSGDRAALGQALAPEIAATTATYRGAERNLERTGVQGAQRTQALAEIGRERAGRIAGLLQGARPMAAGAVTNIGQNATGAGMSGVGNAAGLYGNLLAGVNQVGQGQFDRQKYGDAQREGLLEQLGSLLVQGYGAYGGGKGGTAPLGTYNAGGYSA